METTCNLHLQAGCTTCHKFANECDFGACRRSATHAVIGPTEARRSCAKHVRDIARNYPAAVVEAAA